MRPVFPIRKLRAHLESGGVIGYATQSCFGLGCDPRNFKAVLRLLRIKRRRRDKGLILIADAFSRLAPYLAPLDARTRERLEAKWPGPHTWLLTASHKASRAVRGHHPKVGVRVDAHPDAVALCHDLRTALISTSANRSGKKPLTTYRECRRQFGTQVLVVPGRVGKQKAPSTIQDWPSGRVVRP